MPVCPLCNQPVPVNRGESVDRRVGEHIDRDCRADQKKRRIYANRCSAEGCRKREVCDVSVITLNYIYLSDGTDHVQQLSTQLLS